MKKHSFFLLLLITISLTGEGFSSHEENVKKTSPNDDPRIKNVQKISDDFFIGEGISPTGKKLYFGMQRITNHNQDDLRKYIELTDIFFNRDRGLVSILAEMCAQGTIDNTSFAKLSPKRQQIIGGSQAEYDALLKRICDRDQQDMRKLADKLSQLSAGSNYIHRDVGNYFVFISKSPIKQPITWNLDKSTATIQQYMACNPDLIIFVGTLMDIPSKLDTFDNRGIQKTFNAILDDEYRDVSFPLHGFTAAVAKKFFGKKYFQVRANLSMSGLIRKKLSANEYTEFEVAGAGDQGFKIAVDTLIDFYSGKRK